MWWEYLLNYLIVFAAGGLICVMAQVLIIKTKLTPARILVLFLIGGIVLQAVGVYDFLYKYLGSGISVPIIGFGASLAKGAIYLARTVGFAGAFAGGLVRTAYGVGVAVVASYLVTLFFAPKSK
mgnify:FL=1